VIATLAYLGYRSQVSAVVLSVALGGVTMHLVLNPGWTFRAGVVLTFVGATPLLEWLSDRITLHGFGNGFWLLLITPFLAQLPNAAWGGFELWRRGDVGSAALEHFQLSPES
jgi:preprotein translocase subunit SecY